MKYRVMKDKFIYFSVDEIYLSDFEKEVFSADIVPDFNGTYFPPHLLKSISFQRELLSKDMYFSIMDKHGFGMLEREVDIIFSAQVIQGGYYKVRKEDVRMNILSLNTILSLDNNIFNNTRIPSPYRDNIEGKDEGDVEENLENMNLENVEVFPNLSLYCFNVGQGDCMLVLTPTGSAYIIDTNFYSEKSVDNYINEVKGILRKNGLSEKKIRALIITHKHVDHLRGANVVLDKKEFDIEFFLINHDYKHELKTVEKLLDAAITIPSWVNVNKPGMFKDGKVQFEIVNPDIDTYTKTSAPDMNDSSISMKITYGDDVFFLTGDIGHSYLETKFSALSPNENAVLKVSHHGSRTGTSKEVLRNLNPKFAFVSVGDSKKYKHPHKEVILLLENEIGKSNIDISKKMKIRRLYKSSGKGISRSNWWA